MWENLSEKLLFGLKLKRVRCEGNVTQMKVKDKYGWVVIVSIEVSEKLKQYI